MTNILLHKSLGVTEMHTLYRHIHNTHSHTHIHTPSLWKFPVAKPNICCWCRNRRSVCGRKKLRLKRKRRIENTETKLRWQSGVSGLNVTRSYGCGLNWDVNRRLCGTVFGAIKQKPRCSVSGGDSRPSVTAVRDFTDTNNSLSDRHS
jgi:hypothetical protein